MKKSIKFLMVALLTLGSTTLFAQKFGRLDYQALIPLMPEFAAVQTGIQTVEADYMEHIEGMQVEVNKKIDELGKLPETTSETARQLKNREIVELQQRIQEYYQVAQEGVQQQYVALMAPLQEKADAAVKKICKAQGIIAVFQTGAMIYLDEDQVVDISAPVRAELGIAADAVAPAAAAAQ
jgi:outer membrane protein